MILNSCQIKIDEPIICYPTHFKDLVVRELYNLRVNFFWKLCYLSKIVTSQWLSYFYSLKYWIFVGKNYLRVTFLGQYVFTTVRLNLIKLQYQFPKTRVSMNTVCSQCTRMTYHSFDFGFLTRSQILFLWILWNWNFLLAYFSHTKFNMET